MSTQRPGLALSGGGFRAALFHIGVLAHLAEVELLHEVESISTVSGGSIVGVLYYIKLKNLLESTTDAELKPRDYIDLVAELEDDFLTAVQNNLRWRTFSSIFHNIKMAWPDYSRSDRIGELYDEIIFRPAWKPSRSTPIMMHELKIYPMTPRGEKDLAFHPAEENGNATRTHKVPVLNINATVLNTGHDWRFTASSMGEVLHGNETQPGMPPWEFNPHSLSADIDKNTRLIYDNYDKLCHRIGGFPLGKAVAASAGVPGLFPPLSISDMYVSIESRTDKATTSKLTCIQLVDGGVFDNQGIEALINGSCPCNRLFISDASGSMRDQDEPNTSMLAVLQRTTDILMGRVRDETLSKVHSLVKNNAGALMHMTQGLDVRVQKPRGKECDNTLYPRERVDDPVPELSPRFRGYLSRIRTDLDSFTDIESMSLMAQGYALARSQIPAAGNVPDNAQDTPAGKWKFSAALSWLDKDNHKLPRMYEQQLETASKRFFKPFFLALNQPLSFFWNLLIFVSGHLVLFAALYYLATLYTSSPLTSLLNWIKSFTALQLLGVIAIYAVFELLGRLGRVLKWLSWLAGIHRVVLRILLQTILPALGALSINLYLCSLDKYYLRQGAVDKSTIH